ARRGKNWLSSWRRRSAQARLLSKRWVRERMAFGIIPRPPQVQHRRSAMTIKVGERLPDGKLMESTDFDSATQCAMAPKEVSVGEATKGKKIAIFGLPGAYTPTCSAK